MIDGNMTPESNSEIFCFNDRGWVHNALRKGHRSVILREALHRMVYRAKRRISVSQETLHFAQGDIPLAQIKYYFFTRTGGIPSSGETSLTKTGTAHSLSGLASNLKINMDCMA